MATGEITSSINLAGISLSSKATRTDTGQISHDLTGVNQLPAGKAGTLTSGGGTTSGVAAMATGHGITVSDFVDVYWSGGMRYGMDVTAVNGDDVNIDGSVTGGGDVLPADATTLVVTPRVEIDTDFDGDDLKMIAAVCNKRGHIEFMTNADASIVSRQLVSNEAWSWVSDQGLTNPLAGAVVGKVQASCGEAEAADLRIGVLYDST